MAPLSIAPWHVTGHGQHALKGIEGQVHCMDTGDALDHMLHLGDLSSLTGYSSHNVFAPANHQLSGLSDLGSAVATVTEATVRMP